MAELTVVSLNLRGLHDRWWKREPLVIRGLSELDADVVCLQEAATWCLQARWVAWRLSRRTGRRYRVSQARKRGWRGVFEGIATLTCVPHRGHAVLALGLDRVAQRVELEMPGSSMVIANTHLAHRSFQGDLRRSQAERIRDWLEATQAPSVLVGDFNDEPESDALRTFEARFRSAFAGREPALAGTSPARAPRRIIDHILVVEGVEIVDAGTCFDRAVGGVWPSDHVGLWTKLRF